MHIKNKETHKKYPRKQDYKTPTELVECLKKLYGRFTLDPATSPDNPTKAHIYYTPDDDGLSKEWQGIVFVNPPYKQSKEWIEKGINEIEHNKKVVKIIYLLPASTETRWFYKALNSKYFRQLVFIKSRVKFNGKTPPFPSILLILSKTDYPAFYFLDQKECRLEQIKVKT